MHTFIDSTNTRYLFSPGERPFECDICQKRFTLKHSMMRHRRKHTAAELAAGQGAAAAPSPALSESDEDTTEGELSWLLMVTVCVNSCHGYTM